MTDPPPSDNAASDLRVRRVDDVLITAELASRPSRPPDYENESRALGLLAHEMATNPRGVLQKCAELVMEVCRADSAGISILEPGGASGILRWHAAAGAFAPNLHGTMPREASPCGTVMERNRVLLFNEAARFFPALREAEPRIYENLLAPWHVKGEAVGTLWAIKHTPDGRFDAEDARVLQSLARLAAAAYQMTTAFDDATAERSALRASEERLRNVLDGMDEGFGLMDRDLRIIMQNKAALAIDGRPLEELQGRRHSEVYPDVDPEVIALYERALAEGKPVSLEHRYGWQGTRASWLEMRAFPVPEGLAVFWRDISERKEAEEKLRESEHKYRTLFEAMDEGYLLAEVLRDETSGITDILYLEANPAAVRLAGRDFVGHRMREVDSNYEEYWYDLYERVALTGEPVRREQYAGPHDLWFDVYLFKVGDQPSRRVAAIFQNVTERKRAETILRESEERQAFLLKLSDAVRPLAGAADIQGEITRLLREQLNAGWCCYVDWDPDRKTGLVLRDSASERLPSLVGAHDVSDSAEFLRLLASGAVLTVRDYASYDQLSTRIRQQFTALGFRSMMVAPLVKEGRLIASLLVGDTEIRDWSASEASLLVEVAERTWAAIERAGAEAALRESGERFRLIVENARDYAIFTTDPEGRIDQWYEGAAEVFGWSVEGATGQPMEMTFTPEDQAAGEPQKEREIAAREGRAPNVRWHMRKDGRRIFIDGIASALHDASGALTGFLKIGQDVTERRRAEEHQRTLLAELQHRVRNTLGVVRSIARRTAERSETVEDMSFHFQGRLDAFSRVQSIVTRNPDAGVDLASLIEDELLAHAAREGESLLIEGPEVSLKARAAESLSLGIHELATNAVKYGALGADRGRVAVRWERVKPDGQELLRLVWEENGVQMPEEEPERHGFGLELLQRSLPYDLRAETRVDFRREGLHFEMVMPLGPDVLAASDGSS